MAHDPRHLKWATKELLFYLAPPESRAAHDREMVLAIVQRHPYFLNNASAVLRADREVVLAAVTVCGDALMFASTARRADREVVMAAVQQYPWALKHASAGLQADLHIAHASCTSNAWTLKTLSAEQLASRAAVLAAVKESGYALRDAPVAVQRCFGEAYLNFHFGEHDPDHPREHRDEGLGSAGRLVLRDVSCGLIQPLDGENGDGSGNFRYARPLLRASRAKFALAAAQHSEAHAALKCMLRSRLMAEELRKDESTHSLLGFIYRRRRYVWKLKLAGAVGTTK